jgi:hypothetical protein
MRAYVATTGLLFALIVLAHLWRMTVETHLAREPWYVALTVAVAVLAAWSALLLRRPQPA